MMVMVLAVGAGALGSLEAGAAEGDVTPDMLHASFGLGFHNSIAPIGFRWWLPGQQVGIDFGGGYSVQPTSLVDGGSYLFKEYFVDLGVPITVRRWNRLRFVARPGLLYHRQDVELEVETVGGDLLSEVVPLNTFTFQAEVEAEYYLLDRLSASAGYGAELTHSGFSGSNGSNSSQSIGSDIFQLGFHLYIWNGK
jgi:hypothetical protein